MTSLNHCTGNVIGIDIGGTKTKIGYLDHQCKMKEIGYFPTCQHPDDQIREIIRILKANADIGEFNAIGIAAPGPLNQKKGVINAPPNLRLWKNFKIVDQLQKLFSDKKILLENDANCGALGEALFGSGQGAENVLYLTISTGLGAGIVHNGQIHQGHKGLAAEIWCFDPMTFQGKRGKYNLTDLISGNGFIKQATDRINAGEKTSIPKENINTREIMDAWKNNDPMAVDIIDKARYHLNATVLFLINILAPDVIIIGGGLTFDPEWFIYPLQKQLKELVPLEELKDITVKPASLGADVICYGAIGLLANEDYYAYKS